MRLLITGGTGFVGRRLAAAAAEQGHVVTLLLREPYRQGSPLPAPLDSLARQLRCVYADLRDAQATCEAVRGAAPEMIVHLAAAGVTDPFLPVATAIAHNVTGTLNLLQADCERPGKPAPIVVARTPGERDSQNHYAASKAAVWQFCRMYVRTRGWPIAGAMVYQAYGPGQPEHALVPAALAAARAGADFAMTSGRQVRDWIYVDDVVAGLLAMITRPLPPGETVELGTGRGTTVGEVVDRIYALVHGDGRPLRGARADRPGESLSQIADPSLGLESLGWQAAVSLEDGLERLLSSAS
jgi:nucleoside-diphosphate-sugar epimerase